MLTYDLIKKLCKQKGVTVTGTERVLGFARGSLCKVNTSTPSMEKVKKLADYFEVDIEYLMNNGEVSKQEKKLNARDERDIKKDLDNIMEKLTSGKKGPASYDGEPLDPESAELFKDELEIALRRLKLINKEKYTPKKYKK
ncbi:helix-turn-helix domain-containing protein [Blautia producta]|uniref:helix-turn-helix domain-containing protein n=1 Tax=Blautia producta TaxID=33035 RepID=UPI001D05779E|nr:MULTISPECIES: helix-turn-helix transcriptional regulator [Blautia]MCB5876923.1 helix-turn-helix domain-containing protein [Blautia producta]MDT4376160.1 helix-turn-helix transcriptional regulator [Blautia coccoides]